MSPPAAHLDAPERRTAGARPAPRGFDLLRVPLLGRFLKWRRARLVLQLALGAVALVLVLHGLFGPELAPKNLATLLTWVHYRGLLVLAVLAVGNLFCMGCPLLLSRDLVRRVTRPTRLLPRVLRTKWLAVGLFVAMLFLYEWLDLWGTPAGTAWLIVGYFVAALAVDAFFARGSFCKYVCPIGQFNFVASTLSPLEVRIGERSVCDGCRTKDCIRGRRAPEAPERVVQRGCELDLFLPRKVGNLDCTFCLDCVHACPHDNVAIAARVPGEELAEDPFRSGLGRLSRRPDLALLVGVFTFGALLNAFGMVSPVYAFQAWLADLLGTQSEGLVLLVLFALGLVVLPLALVVPTGLAARALAGSRGPLRAHLVRFAYGLAPLGVGVWAAHYSFHFLTGLWTFVPVTQLALQELGLGLLGEPDWGRGGMTAASVKPIELGLLGLGLVGSLAVTLRIAQREAPRAAWRVWAPWAALHVALVASAVWLLQQPMEMRGTFL